MLALLALTLLALLAGAVWLVLTKTAVRNHLPPWLGERLGLTAEAPAQPQAPASPPGQATPSGSEPAQAAGQSPERATAQTTAPTPLQSAREHLRGAADPTTGYALAQRLRQQAAADKSV